jgi:transposase
LESLTAGYDVKQIAKQLDVDYSLVWQIKNKWDYYMMVFTEVCDEQ